MTDFGNIAYQVSVWALPVLLAITLHEAAHAYAAYWLGDDYAHRQGRTSLNPLKHIDPFGTLLLPGLLLATGAGFIIGYAKPVPVLFDRLKPRRLGIALVAVAGPAANVLIALVAAVLLYVAPIVPDSVGPWLLQNLVNAIKINAILAAFNLLPVPPLDGGRILMAALPPQIAWRLRGIERAGIFIVLGFALVVPMALREFGINFNPVADWAISGAEIIIGGVYTITGWR